MRQSRSGRREHSATDLGAMAQRLGAKHLMLTKDDYRKAVEAGGFNGNVVGCRPRNFEAPGEMNPMLPANDHDIHHGTAEHRFNRVSSRRSPRSARLRRNEESG